MRTTFLLPNYLKVVGWLLFLTSTITYLYFTISGESIDEYLLFKTFAIYQDGFFMVEKSNSFQFIENPMLDEILLVSFLLGALILGFSKTKNEDEMVAKIRYESLVWATIFNIVMIIITTLTIYGMVFLNFIYFFIVSSLFFFVIRFHYQLYQLQKISENDE
ncbi:MAG: hypothetical protein ACK4JX_04650 [Flavobacterium sp.]